MVAQLFHALLVFPNMNVAGWVLALVGGGLEFVGVALAVVGARDVYVRNRFGEDSFLRFLFTPWLPHDVRASGSGSLNGLGVVSASGGKRLTADSFNQVCDALKELRNEINLLRSRVEREMHSVNIRFEQIGAAQMSEVRRLESESKAESLRGLRWAVFGLGFVFAGAMCQVVGSALSDWPF